MAAVAATSPHLAEEALALIDIDYEVLSPVLNASDAMKDDAPIIHERLLTLSSTAMRAGSRQRPESRERELGAAEPPLVEVRWRPNSLRAE